MLSKEQAEELASSGLIVGRGMLVVVSFAVGRRQGYVDSSRVEDRSRTWLLRLVYNQVPARRRSRGRSLSLCLSRNVRRDGGQRRLLETAYVHGNRYGTAYSETERVLSGGRDIILEIDVQGAESGAARCLRL
ncbi:MAG: hypothetical protein WKF84_29735 [Pyrinomonadaceae bacterium]